MRKEPGTMRAWSFKRRPAIAIAIVFLTAACSAAPAAPAASPSPLASQSAESGSLEPSAAATMASPETSSIRLGVSAIEAVEFIPVLAKEAGIYDKYGLSVEVFPFDGSQKMVQASLSGQLDATTGASATAITSQATDVPFTSIAVFSTKFVDDIISAPDVKTAEDLKGKRMAVSGLGGQSHNEVILALKELGLDPSEVAIVQIGGQGARIAALEAGSVEAIPVDSALRGELTSAGYNVLLPLQDITVNTVTNDLQVKREFLEKNPGTVQALLAANLESAQLLYTDSDKAIDLFAKWAQVDREEAETSIEAFKKVVNRGLQTTPDAYENLRDFIALGNPDVAGIDVSSSFDFSGLERLKEIGLYEQLDVPE
jgi:NitT/TauT family transport system substrate-binding protein